MNFLKVIIFICLMSSLLSCKKTDNDNNNDNQNDNWISDTYYFSSQDKSLFDFYYTNKIIDFIDSAGNHLTFQADSLYDITTHQEGNLDVGEDLQINYLCQTDYFPNYKIGLNLNAKPDSVVALNIIFGTGTYWTDQGNDYVLSNFYFNPKRPYDLDSINPWGDTVHYDFSDSITLQNKTFYNVFYSKHEGVNTDIKQTIHCYYTNDKGIIAFKNLDGEFWIRD